VIPATLLLATSGVMANDIDWELYGSLRLAGETVDTDGGAKDYSGLRDAYTRIGAKAKYAINDEWTILGQLEAPFDLANMELQNPFDPDEQYRIAKLQVSGPIGTAWYGRGWLPFYNYIQYPTDYFSTFYSGFDTYTSFRKSHTFYYSSPTFSGFQVAFASSDDNGAEDDNRNQYVLSYANGGLTLAIGRDDFQNSNDLIIDGASVSYTTGPWYFSTQYQKISSDDSTPGYYADDNEGYSVLGQYSIDEKNTVRAKYANFDNNGDDIYQVAWDHQYNDVTKFFVEYYDEETPAAVTDDKDPEVFSYVGGSVFTIGVRYDFSSK
ncbi:MAG: porin, partial [Gammaproteobacteria bacterium]